MLEHRVSWDSQAHRQPIEQMDDQQAAEYAELTAEDTPFHAWNNTSDTSDEAFHSRNDPFDTWNLTFHASDKPSDRWNEASEA